MSRVSPIAVAESLACHRVGRLLREQVRGPERLNTGDLQAEALQSKVWACRMAFGPSASRGRRQAVRQQYSQPAHARSGRAFRAHDSANRFYDATVDVFAPCALSAIINDETFPLEGKNRRGFSQQSAGGTPAWRRTEGRNILYAPDYAINAAGSSIFPTNTAAPPTGKQPIVMSTVSSARCRRSSNARAGSIFQRTQRRITLLKTASARSKPPESP